METQRQPANVTDLHKHKIQKKNHATLHSKLLMVSAGLMSMVAQWGHLLVEYCLQLLVFFYISA